MKAVPRLIERDAVAGGSGSRRRAAPGGFTLRQLQQYRIADARVGETVLAEAESAPQLLAHCGRQPLEHVGHKLWRLAAHALLQVERAFGRQPGIQGEHATNQLGRILDRRKLIRGDRDEAGYHRHPGVLLAEAHTRAEQPSLKPGC
jgi:hypothetical protein